MAGRKGRPEACPDDPNPASGSKYAAVGAGLLAILVMYGCGSAPRETHSRQAGPGHTTQVRHQARQPRRRHQRTRPRHERRPKPQPVRPPHERKRAERRRRHQGQQFAGGRPERAARRSRPLATATFAAPSKTLNCTPGALNPAVTQSNIHSTICVSGYTDRIDLRPAIPIRSSTS